MAMVVLVKDLEPDTACVLCSLYYHVNESPQQRFPENNEPPVQAAPAALRMGRGPRVNITASKLSVMVSPSPLGSV